MLSEAITSSLRQIDDLELIEDPSRRKVYESDGLTAIAQIPPLVGLPYSLQALQETLRVCHTHGVPMVARGAGTGLSGGATPLADGLLIGLAKFNRILEVDPVKMTARACFMRRTRPPRSRARLAAMSPKIPAACIA